MYIVVLNVALDDRVFRGKSFINIVHRTGSNTVPCLNCESTNQTNCFQVQSESVGKDNMTA